MKIATQGYVSEAVERDLKERVLDAMLLSLKTGSEEGFGAIVQQMGQEYQATLLTMLNDPKQRGNIGVKAGTGYLSLVITAGFNVALTEGDTMAEHLGNAAKATVNDLVFKAVLNRVAGAAAGPIGWTWSVLDIIDTLCYDQGFVDKTFEDGVNSMKEAQKASSWWDGMMQHQYAREQLDLAREMQTAHNLIKAPSHVFNAFWESVSGSSAEQAPPPVSQSMQTPYNLFQSGESSETRRPEHVQAIQFN